MFAKALNPMKGHHGFALEDISQLRDSRAPILSGSTYGPARSAEYVRLHSLRIHGAGAHTSFPPCLESCLQSCASHPCMPRVWCATDVARFSRAIRVLGN